MNFLIRSLPVDEITPVCWEGIRSEYFKVWADFPLTTIPFGIGLTRRQHHALGQMLVAMDLIDTAIDRVASQSRREQICKEILSWMNGADSDLEILGEIDLNRLYPLRIIIAELEIRTEFLQAAANVFQASEGKRNARSMSALLRNLIDEGQSAAEMTICILGTNTNHRLNNFLKRIMRIGTMVDTQLDYREDVDRGLLQLTPNLLFQARIVFAIARQLPGLVWQFPDRRFLWRYCISYISSNPIPLVHPQTVD
jgi:hypothetical protein